MPPFWVMIAGYLIGASLTFRWKLLAKTEETERCADEYRERFGENKKLRSKLNDSIGEWRMYDRMFSAMTAAGWPPVVLFWVWGKILFPKGINTKYAIQKAHIASLEARQAEHERCLAVLRESNQRIPQESDSFSTAANGV